MYMYIIKSGGGGAKLSQGGSNEPAPLKETLLSLSSPLPLPLPILTPTVCLSRAPMVRFSCRRPGQSSTRAVSIRSTCSCAPTSASPICPYPRYTQVHSTTLSTLHMIFFPGVAWGGIYVQFTCTCTCTCM